MSTIPDEYLQFAVDLLNNFRYVGIPELYKSFEGIVESALSKIDCDIVFVAPIATKMGHKFYTSSALL